MENEGNGSGWLLALLFGIGGWWLIAAYWPKSLCVLFLFLGLLGGLLYPTPRR